MIFMRWEALACIVLLTMTSGVVLGDSPSEALCRGFQKGDKKLLAAGQTSDNHFLILATDFTGFRVHMPKFDHPTGASPSLRLGREPVYRLKVASNQTLPPVRPDGSGAFIVTRGNLLPGWKRADHLAVILADSGRLVGVPVDDAGKYESAKLATSFRRTFVHFFSKAPGTFEVNTAVLVILANQLVKGNWSWVLDDAGTVNSVDIIATNTSFVLAFPNTVHGGWTLAGQAFYGFNNTEASLTYLRKSTNSTESGKVSFENFFNCDPGPTEEPDPNTSEGNLIMWTFIIAISVLCLLGFAIGVCICCRLMKRKSVKSKSKKKLSKSKSPIRVSSKTAAAAVSNPHSSTIPSSTERIPKSSTSGPSHSQTSTAFAAPSNAKSSFVFSVITPVGSSSTGSATTEKKSRIKSKI